MGGGVGGERGAPGTGKHECVPAAAFAAKVLRACQRLGPGGGAAGVEQGKGEEAGATQGPCNHPSCRMLMHNPKA